MLGYKRRTKLDFLKPDDYSRVLNKQTDVIEQDAKQGASTREFQKGDSVLTLDFRREKENRWIPAKVITRTGPLSYRLEVNGQTWKRHIDQMIKTDIKEQPSLRNSLEQLPLTQNKHRDALSDPIARGGENEPAQSAQDEPATEMPNEREAGYGNCGTGITDTTSRQLRDRSKLHKPDRLTYY